jgi:PD-(D/E)XK nuclease superfamily
MKHLDPIIFDPVKHAYYEARTHTRYLSVTQVIGQVEHEFDTGFHSQGMANRHGHSPEYWAEKWKKKTNHSLNRGTELHNRKEELAYASGLDIDGEGIHRVQNEARMADISGYEYYLWPDGVYPELKLWNHHYKLAGRADKVRLFTRHGYRYASVGDYKTNEVIKKKSWWDRDTGYRMLKAPLDHLMDCNYIKYTLQMSMYQFMLEEMGFRPYTRSLYHYEPLPKDLGEEGELSPKPTIHKLDYLRDDVIRLLNHVTNGKVA